MKRNVKLPTILGIVVLIAGIAAGVILTQYNQIFRLGASPDQDPKDVRITNITDKSFTVTWMTDKTTVGHVVFGESTNPNQTALETDNTVAKNIHFVTVTGLKPATSYNFKINSDGALKDNSGIPWKVTTAPTLGSSTNNYTISGTVTTVNGQPVSSAVIFVNIGTASPLSAKTSTNGSWIIALGNARTSDLQNYASVIPTTLVDVLAQAGSVGISTAKVYVSGANPIPPMVIGQNHDFRQNSATGSGDNPNSNLSLPKDENSGSRFNVGENATGSGTVTTVTLESVDANETVTTTQPEFFGKAPANTEIVIKVESTNPQTDTVEADATGNWNWTPPANLEPGNHKVTITWRDAAGVLRTLTRNFVVEAKEGPAFVATPSATPKSSPKASPKASASATPRVTRPATDSGTPVAGVATPTIVLLSLGFSLIAVSIYIGKKSFEA